MGYPTNPDALESYWKMRLGEWLLARPNRGWDLFEAFDLPLSSGVKVWVCQAVEGIHEQDSHFLAEGRGKSRVEALETVCRMLYPGRFAP